MQSFISVVPPLITILTATLTKRVVPSLVLGLLTGTILLTGSVIGGVSQGAAYLAKSLADEDSIYVILFLFTFGALAEIIKVSGGIKGFSRFFERIITTEKGALLSVWAMTPITFLDCCFHVIATGTVTKPLLEKVKGSKEKLAFVINVTSSQLIVLIPFATTYVGYIIGVISSASRKAGIGGSSYLLYLKSIPFNFYSISILFISVLVIFYGLGFSERAAKLTDGEVEPGVHGSHEAHEQCEFEEKVQPRIINLVMPLVTLISLVIFFLWWTGRKPGLTFWQTIINAEFEKAIFIAALGTVVLTSVFYLLQKIPVGELESHFLSGGTELLPPIVVLTLSWGIAAVTQDLGFADFISGTLGPGLPGYAVAPVVFLIGSVTSYFMGTAWGTWALIMPLALPLAVVTGADVPLVIGAVLAGGSVGDNISPLGETPVLTSAIADLNLIRHVKSELPYGMAAIIISTIAFLGVSFII